MAILNILRYPDARLHKVAAPVTVFDESLKKLVADMAETMYAAPGIGLAATQVDVHKRVIVVDVSERRDSLVVLVNPEILEATGESDIEEGCLSVPGIYELVPRAERVKVRAYDQNGNPFTLQAQGNYIHAPGKFVAALGVNNLVVVETDDALLITTREQAQDVGKVVNYLDEKKLRNLV